MANPLLSFTLILSMWMTLIASQTTTLQSKGCAIAPSYGPSIDESTNCVAGFPHNRSLEVLVASSYMIEDTNSCFLAICDKCTGCAGVEYNTGTGMCSACYQDEIPVAFTRAESSLQLKGQSCTANSNCSTGLCDQTIGMCYQTCDNPPSNSSCPIHNFNSSQHLIIPESPQFIPIFDQNTKSFIFYVTTTYTRTNTSYVLGLDPFNDNRSIRDVGLCENRNSDLFTYDNRAWWCSPSDAYGIGSPSYLAWGPSMSWNQTAKDCNHVVFARAFTITDLTKDCSKGSVTAFNNSKKIVYDGTFHVTLAQEDFEWTPTSLIPLAKWNFPFQFSFKADFSIVVCFSAERITTKVKQGVSVKSGNRLSIFIDTRIEKLYGDGAYVVLVSGMNSSKSIVVFNQTGSNSLERGLQNSPNGTRSHQPGAVNTGTGCVFPGCQQVWNFLSYPIANNQNFTGIYNVTFRVRNSTQSPNEDIDSFTVSITLDASFVPENTTVVDNLALGSRVSIFSNPAFTVSPPPTGFRQTQRAYAIQSIDLAQSDRDLWALNIINATVCVAPINGTLGCDNSVEKFPIIINGNPVVDTSNDTRYHFNTTIYSPGSAPGYLYPSATALSFSISPLTMRYPVRRSHCIMFVSTASLASGTATLKRHIQQNAQVVQMKMFNIQTDNVITDYETNDEVTTNEGSGDEFFSIESNMMIAVIGFAVAGTVMLVMFISFLVFRYKTIEATEAKAVMLNSDSETGSETATYL